MSLLKYTINFSTTERDLIKARKEVDLNPTKAQKEASNYKVGRVTINGFKIAIENPKGSIRSGKDPNGKKWSIKMKHDYGYFIGTKAYDGDAIDCFIGPNLNSKNIWVVDQYLGGKFDESKVMMGFDSKDEATQGYLSNYDKDWKGLGKITYADIETFREWLYDGKKQRKPFHEYKLD